MHQVYRNYLEFSELMNLLARLTIDRSEGSTHDVVTANHLVKAPSQRIYIKMAFKHDGAG